MEKINDNNEKFDILRMLHNDLQMLSCDRAYYVEDSILYIVDDKGNCVLKEFEFNIAIIGSFSVIVDDLFNNVYNGVQVTNHITHITKNIENIGFSKVENKLGRDLLLLRDEAKNSLYIFNKNVECCCEIPNVTWYECFKVDEEAKNVYIVHGSKADGSNRTALINIETECIEFYDFVDIKTDSGYKYSVVGTEVCNVGISAHKGMNANIKYALVDNNRKQYDEQTNTRLLSNGWRVLGKAYQSIIKPKELDSTKYFITYEYDESKHDETNYTMGLIDDTGVEYLEPIYDRIWYIGSDNFITEYKGNRGIYNTLSGVVEPYKPSNKIHKHDVLPICFIHQDDCTECIDSSGIRFNVLDIAKHFDCYYSEEFPEYMMIIVNGVRKFFTNTLISITVANLVSRLMKANWNKIQ